MTPPGKTDRAPAGRRLRDVIGRQWRGVSAGAALCGVLLLLVWMIIPGILVLWSGVLAQLTVTAGLPASALGQMPILVPGLPALQLPVIEFRPGTPDHHDWLINIGGAAVAFLLAGLLPSMQRTLIRALCVLHIVLVTLSGLGTQETDAFIRHAAALDVLTLCVIVALPVFLTMTHSVVEPALSRRLLVWLTCSSYLVLAHPVKLIGHLIVLDLLGPFALPTLFLAFGPVLDLLAVSALLAWAASWPRSTT
jgi:hypothetical protein